LGVIRIGTFNCWGGDWENRAVKKGIKIKIWRCGAQGIRESNNVRRRRNYWKVKKVKRVIKRIKENN
jgi:hypothetical protein